MIHHVVAFQLAAQDNEIRQRHAVELRDRLEALADVIPGVVSLSVHQDLGEVDSHWPLVLVSAFESLDALNGYMAHPSHRAVIAWMNDGLVVDRVAVDYTDQ